MCHRSTHSGRMFFAFGNWFHFGGACLKHNTIPPCLSECDVELSSRCRSVCPFLSQRERDLILLIQLWKGWELDLRLDSIIPSWYEAWTLNFVPLHQSRRVEFCYEALAKANSYGGVPVSKISFFQFTNFTEGCLWKLYDQVDLLMLVDRKSTWNYSHTI